jgi:hypothetical protein
LTSTLTFDLENSRFKVIIREGSGVQAGKIAFQRTHQNILGTSRWSRAGPSGEPSRFGLPSAMFLFLFYLFFLRFTYTHQRIPAPAAPRDRTSPIHIFLSFLRFAFAHRRTPPPACALSSSERRPLRATVSPWNRSGPRYGLFST